MARAKIDKPYNGGTWSKARFMGFLRSALRKASTRWGPKNEVKRAARRAYKGPNNRQKWEYRCEICGLYFSGKEVEVDHIIPCGSLTCLEELPGFARRLFCEVDGLRVLCKECHATRVD
jgi:5-methylcytosine-specific restriction endonuclease McrA